MLVSLTHHTLDVVMIGRSILSSSRNPVAELYRGLINELAHRGHRTTYLEPYDFGGIAHRDMLRSPYCEVWTYGDVDTLLEEYLPAIQSADLVLLGSDVPETDRIAQWICNEARGITIYYDTDLARTARVLASGEDCGNCLSRDSVGSFHLYLSTTGGPALEQLARIHGMPCARPLYESIDPFAFYRMDIDKSYDLGFMGNFKTERYDLIEALLLAPARTTPNRQFVLAGDNYPDSQAWPQNVTYLEHLPHTNHVDFYNRQACSLVLGRNDRRTLGHTPSRQLLAAAACGVPVLTAEWDGIGEFFEDRRELYCVASQQDVLDILYGTDETTRRRVGSFARARVLADHTTSHRAEQLLSYWQEVAD